MINIYQTMWLAHGSQVINHMMTKRKKEETHLVGGILYAQVMSGTIAPFTHFSLFFLLFRSLTHIPLSQPVTSLFILIFRPLPCVRADCLATNTEYCDRCTHVATQATNVARIKTEGTKGLLQGQMAVLESSWIKLACRCPIKSCGQDLTVRYSRGESIEGTREV